MYVYIDESGNTGENLFDQNQPVFMIAALMTKTNFDLIYRKKLRKICKKIDVEVLHANELGFGKLEEVALDLLKVLKKSDARVFLSRVVKIDLAATKLVDTIFDSGENLSVPWHIYNYKPLRLLLVIKVAYLLDEQLLKVFWSSLMDKHQTRAYDKFKKVLHDILIRVEALPDERSREIVKEAVIWAINNPEAIHLHINARIHKYGHLPNIAIFPQLLGGIDLVSQKWKRPVREIIHDRQSQFGPTLITWHDIVSNAEPGIITLPGGEEHTVQKVFGSRFRMSSSNESVGIQLIDVILWLFKKIQDDKEIPINCTKLMSQVFRKGIYDEISLKGISYYLSNVFDKIENEPISEDQMAKAQEMLEFAERRRQIKMREYSESKYKNMIN